jgi:hypothetical protein
LVSFENRALKHPQKTPVRPPRPPDLDGNVLKTYIKFSIATLAALLVASLALNIYQLHLFANTELTGDGNLDNADESKADTKEPTDQFSSFTRDIDLQKDAYQPIKSIPYWIKSVLATALNVDLADFDSQMKIFCYQLRGSNSDIRNCIDEFKIWSIKEKDTEEAYVAIIGEPADTADTTIEDLCAEQSCNSYRLTHLARKGESSSIVADTRFTLAAKNSKNLSINLLKISQGGIPAWTLSRSVPFKNNFLKKMSLHLSDGREVRNIGELIIDGTWVDGECLLASNHQTSVDNSCERQLNGNLRTDFENSTYWYPSNLVYTNELNVKESSIKLNFDIETQHYMVPEAANSEIIEMIDQLSFSSTENENISGLEKNG